ncbi:hypothetical protein SELMODRAFT_427917 [Selaginella moellendorffii]|uniref:Aldehyde dehydrogenase domain-containing protein n=1 Tax=Selaginella moellendorffii TaxID=88036 RepID=D8T143_SELML|nr:hypothetical protein SELMODRAFT_427917 [Selaginella moellendorffii]
MTCFHLEAFHQLLHLDKQSLCLEKKNKRKEKRETSTLDMHYEDDPNNFGLCVADLSWLSESVSAASELKLQLAVHAIGDAAYDDVLGIYTDAISKHPRQGHRLRVEHAQHLSPGAHLKFGKFSISVSMQPEKLLDDAYYAMKKLGGSSESSWRDPHSCGENTFRLESSLDSRGKDFCIGRSGRRTRARSQAMDLLPGAYRQAFSVLKAGGVCLNDLPSMRIGRQPYGGIKDSGIQQEGVKYAMDNMLETKVLVMRNVGNTSYF